MKVLITGSTGLLGSMLHRTAVDHEVHGCYNTNRLVPFTDHTFHHLDITDAEEVTTVLNLVKPDVVIHCAAKASPDWCESNQEEAYKVNVEGSKNLIDWCVSHKSHIVFISSNAVFDGTQSPYTEESLPNPQDTYGKQKLLIEQYLVSSGVSYLIIRSMCLYGWNNPFERKNFTSLLIEKCMTNQPMNITNDVYCNFISSVDVAVSIWKLLTRQGIYHIAGEERLTHWKLAQEVVKVFGCSGDNLTSVSMNQLKGFIKRPVDTCFDCSKAYASGVDKPMDVRLGLRTFVSSDEWMFV